MREIIEDDDDEENEDHAEGSARREDGAQRIESGPSEDGGMVGSSQLEQQQTGETEGTVWSTLAGNGEAEAERRSRGTVAASRKTSVRWVLPIATEKLERPAYYGIIL